MSHPPKVPRATGSEENFTREQVQAFLDEQEQRINAAWQPKLTRAQQDAAQARRESAETAEQFGTLDSRIDELEHRGPVGGNGEITTPADVMSQIDWDSISTGNDLKNAVQKAFAALSSQQAQSPAPAPAVPDGLTGRVDSMEAEIWDGRLESLEQNLRSTYRGITDEQVRQVIETAHDTGVGDLSYVAHQVLGAPDRFMPENTSHITADQDAVRERREHAVLSGRATAVTSQEQEPTVKLRSGIQGHADARTAAINWARGRHGSR